MKKILLLIGTILVGVTVVFLLVKEEPKKFTKTDYTKINLEGIDNLMIIAHPDDDILWGGKELIENDYFVVCITCGVDDKRVHEFEEVMGKTNDAYAMLGYPDKTHGQKDDWSKVKDEIKVDIENIYKLKSWQKIVTHNPEGEYGHIHHKLTDKLVTEVVDHDTLYYFGKYYPKSKIEDNKEKLKRLDDDVLETKKELLNLYVTQDKTIHETFGHMIEYEDVVKYEDWKELYEEE